jgi:hypothetical protein
MDVLQSISSSLHKMALWTESFPTEFEILYTVKKESLKQ